MMLPNGRARHQLLTSASDDFDIDFGKRLQKRSIHYRFRRLRRDVNSGMKTHRGSGVGVGFSHDRSNSFSSRFRDDNRYKSTFDVDNKEEDALNYDTWEQDSGSEAKGEAAANKYELDWYFWDKDGKFKIIRYQSII